MGSRACERRHGFVDEFGRSSFRSVTFTAVFPQFSTVLVVFGVTVVATLRAKIVVAVDVTRDARNHFVLAL